MVILGGLWWFAVFQWTALNVHNVLNKNLR